MKDGKFKFSASSNFKVYLKPDEDAATLPDDHDEEIDIFIIPIERGSTYFEEYDVTYYGRSDCLDKGISSIDNDGASGYSIDMATFSKLFESALILISFSGHSSREIGFDIVIEFDGVELSKRIEPQDVHGYNTLLVGGISNKSRGWTFSSADLCIGEEVGSLLTFFRNNSGMNERWCNGMLTLSALKRESVLGVTNALPWADTNYVEEYIDFMYKPSHAQAYGCTIINDLRARSIKTDLDVSYKQLIYLLVADGARFETCLGETSTSMSDIDRIDLLVSSGSDYKGWTQAILDTFDGSIITEYCKNNANKADQLYRLYPKEYLYNYISRKAQREDIGLRFNL